MRYEINPETFAIDIYHDGAEIPFWHQPDYPNGDKFDSVKEAETWAKLAIKSHDDAYGFTPPDGKGLPENPKPTQEQINEAKLARIGLSVDELKAMLGL